MELNKTKKSIYVLIFLSGCMLFLLGSWWLYLVFKLANKLNELEHPLMQGNLVAMVKYEGASFIIFLFVLTGTLLYIYLQDFKKTKSLQAFFSSLTHELKTPLASMKLQAQVIQSLIEDTDVDSKIKAKLNKYAERLSHDGSRLEDQLDNHLQLSRVERNADLNLRTINFNEFAKKESLRFKKRLTFTIDDNDIFVLADDFALQTILRNISENAIRHSGKDPVTIHYSFEESQNKLIIHIKDNGNNFSGNLTQLGQLFYKHNSPKGSGIGLYLARMLMSQMNGQISFTNSQSFETHLTFPIGNKEGVSHE
jgi:signal transduction histidine kinase